MYTQQLVGIIWLNIEKKNRKNSRYIADRSNVVTAVTVGNIMIILYPLILLREFLRKSSCQYCIVVALQFVSDRL